MNCFISVEAKLGEWSAWESCSKTCGYGIRQRTRRCIGSNQFGESYCNDEGLGLSQQAERCFERSCPGRVKFTLLIASSNYLNASCSI